MIKFVSRNLSNQNTYFNNSIDWARLLTQTAIDTLCHIYVVANSSTASVRTRLRLNCDGLNKGKINNAVNNTLQT